MPIKGLTNQPMQFTEIGHLRKGAPKPKNGKRPGKDLDYFRADFEPEEEAAAAMFVEAYGEKPKEVNIRLPFNTVEENFDAWREAYVRGGLIHRCDGEYVRYEVDRDTGSIEVMNGLGVDGKRVKCDGSAECKPTGRLRVIIPELRRLAFVTVHTTSIWDILNISRQLEAIRHVNDGQLQKVPLILRRRDREISTPSGTGGKRARRVKSLLSIEADPVWVEAQLLPSAETLALPPGYDVHDFENEENARDFVEERAAAPEPKEPAAALEPGPKLSDKQQRWLDFLAEHDLTDLTALAALGFPSVNEWCLANKPKLFDDALLEILAVSGKG